MKVFEHVSKHVSQANRKFLSSQAPNLEDLSHLPPEQRRKKLQQRIDELSRELQKEMDQRLETPK